MKGTPIEKIFRRIFNTLKVAVAAVCAFFVTFFTYYIIGCCIFPVNEENVLQAPDMYPLVGILIATIAAWLVVKKPHVKWPNVKKPRVTGSTVKKSYIVLPIIKKLECNKGKKFKIPIFKSERNKLATCLFNDAKIAAQAANEAETVSEFIKQYDIILERFEILSLLTGKVTCISGDLQVEFWSKQSEFQDKLTSAIDRIGNAIISERNGIYKYEPYLIEKRISEYRNDLAKCAYRFNQKNAEFAKIKYRYVCGECGMLNVLKDSAQQKNAFLNTYSDLDMSAFIENEKNWRCEQMGILPVECELNNVDAMDGHSFEYWCAELLKKNGYVKVGVTPGSGDHGVDVLAEKDGIKYAIQCKCYSKDLDNTPVQEVFAGKEMYDCHVGVVMTNRHFTAGAKELAAKDRVLLWDRDVLKKMFQKASSC